MSPGNSLRENLFNAEPISLERQERFQRELALIVEPTLPRSHKLYYSLTLACIAIGIPGAVCGLLLDVDHRWIWGLNLVGLVPMATWILYILRRGAEPRRTMQSMSKALVGISAAIAFVLVYLGIQNPSLNSVLWSLMGMLIFLLASSINLWNRVLATEGVAREHLSRLEYRIADLSSRVSQPNNSENATS